MAVGRRLDQVGREARGAQAEVAAGREWGRRAGEKQLDWVCLEVEPAGLLWH